GLAASFTFSDPADSELYTLSLHDALPIYGGVDGVLGHIAFGAEVVAAEVPVLRQEAPLHLHLVGGLPGAGDHFPHPPHGLGIRRDHAEGAEVVEDVLGGDGLAADAGIGEGHVLGDIRVQVVAHHQHVEVFIHGVDGIGRGGVGGRGQHVGFAAGLGGTGAVAAAGTLGVVGVDGATLEGGQGVLHEAGFVEGVGVDRSLDVVLFRHRQAAVDGRRGGAPVLVEFHAHGAGFELLLQGLGQA